MQTNDYTEGQVCECKAFFTRSLDGVAITPTNLTVTVLKPDGTTDEYAKVGEAIHARLVINGTGIITLVYDLTDATEGNYRVQFRAEDEPDGSGVCTRYRRRFRVLPSVAFPSS